MWRQQTTGSFRTYAGIWNFSTVDFSNSLLKEEHLSDKRCNALCALFNKGKEKQNGIIIHSDLLLDYLKVNYPNLYFVSSTTKVLTEFEELRKEINREEFGYVVPDFRLNKALDKWKTLSEEQKDKVEFLCNECCWFGCRDRKICYEAVSRKILEKVKQSILVVRQMQGMDIAFQRQ